MTIVIDASVIVAALVDTGTDGCWAESLIAGEILIAPELVMVEATNILRRLELARDISPLESGLAQKDLMRLDIPAISFPPICRTNLDFAQQRYELRRLVCGIGRGA